MHAHVLVSLVLCGGAVALCAQAQGPKSVQESARRIPIAYDVDVVIVGGSTGAVSAATAAAEAGSRVFLAAPRPYLGEDMCATLRLWLEADETPADPLARKLFAAAQAAAAPVRGLPFTYEADMPSAGVHRDTERPSRLADGRWANPQTESVQYDGDVTIAADLGKVASIDEARILVYHRKDFQVGRVVVAVSRDKRQWQQVAVIKNDRPPQKDLRAPALPFSAPVKQEVRYVRFFVKRAPGSTRVLVGEIVLVGTAKQTAPAARSCHGLVAPFHVKRTLDRALLDAKVQFLFGCYATDVLRDAAGRPCGIVMANRAGRQAVVAKVIIDATDRAHVARLAGAKFRALPAGDHTFRRVVIGGQARSGQDLTARKIGLAFPGGAARGRRGGVPRPAHEVIEYTLRLPLRDASFASWAQAEQRARDLTYHEGQVRASEMLLCVPPDSMVGRARGAGAGQGVDRPAIDAFRPAGVERVFVLGGCADIPRDAAARLLRPPALMAVGRRIGAAAAEQAKALGDPRDPRLPGGAAKGAAAGDVREVLAGVRPLEPPAVSPPERAPASIPQEARPLPVLGAYDVVVIGGGTSGAPAGIAAARHGGRALVVEYQHGLGGVGTLGLIGRYHRGYRGGFTAEVDRATGATRGAWSVVRKMEWWRRALRKAGADVWFGTLGCGAVVRDRRVVGAVVATPHGRGVVLAKVVIDATGSADVAAAAGADCLYTDGSCVAVQGTGLPVAELGANYTNTDFTITDETDMVDVWQLLVYARQRYQGGFDLGRLIDTRERRRVVGDFTLTILDQINQRTYGDTIAQAVSNLDTHGYTVAPYLTLRHPGRVQCFVPYRCLLPKGLDGMLVIGLGLSAHRDAIPFVRMQADLQNLGYAAGAAAAMAAEASVPPRRIDVRKLQGHLVEIGSLPEEVLKHEDSYPLPASRIAEAVRTVPDGYRGAAVLLAHPKEAVALLRRAYERAGSERERLAYAHVLAVLGDAAGLPTLIAAVEAAPDLGDGYEYRGMGHDHSRRRMSQIDSVVQALGRTRDRRATPAILAKLKLLSADKAFSHHYAIAAALEALGDPAAAQPLAGLLAKPGMSGHAIRSLADAVRLERPPLGNASRLRSFREIVLARALFRCGDHNGAARRILRAYRGDLRGHFARHAAAVLQTPSP